MIVNAHILLLLLYFELIVEHTFLPFVRCVVAMVVVVWTVRYIVIVVISFTWIVKLCWFRVWRVSCHRVSVFVWCRYAWIVLCVTVYGTSLKYGVSLSRFRCLTRTQSPTLSPLSFTFRLLSAYRLWYSLFHASFCRASRCRFTRFRLCKIASFSWAVLLNNSSGGGTPELECDVVQYCNRNL